MSTQYFSPDVKGLLIDLLTQQKAEQGIDAGVPILRAYPRQKTQMPCVVLLRSASGEQEAALGQGYAESPNLDGGIDLSICAVFNDTLEITVWSPNEQLRDRLFKFVRDVITSQKPFLMPYGIRYLRLSHAQDEEIDDQLILQTYIYRAVLYYEVQTELRTLEHVDASPPSPAVTQGLIP